MPGIAWELNVILVYCFWNRSLSSWHVPFILSIDFSHPIPVFPSMCPASSVHHRFTSLSRNLIPGQNKLHVYSCLSQLKVLYTCIHWQIYCPLIRLIMVVHPQVSSPGPVPPIGLAPCHDLVTAFHHKVLMVITPWISSGRYWYHSLEFVGERLIGSNSSLTACPCVISESST